MHPEMVLWCSGQVATLTAWLRAMGLPGPFAMYLVMVMTNYHYYYHHNHHYYSHCHQRIHMHVRTRSPFSGAFTRARRRVARPDDPHASERACGLDSKDLPASSYKERNTGFRKFQQDFKKYEIPKRTE